jgi:hypothetical protein
MIKELAKTIVSDLARIQKDQIVNILAYIYNTPEHEDPLLELPLVEELALAIKEKNAFSILDLFSLNIKKQYTEENKRWIYPTSYFLDKIEPSSAFIEVSWESVSDLFNSFDRGYSYGRFLKSYWNEIYRKNKKLIFLNYPSHALANLIDIDYDTLLDSYLHAANCDYNYLKSKGQTLDENLYSYSYFQIESENDNLKLKAKKNKKPELYTGNLDTHKISIIPAGIIVLPLDRSRLNGTFVAHYAYYQNVMLRNVKVNFKDGHIRFVTFQQENEDNFMFQNALMNSGEECYLSYGFNEAYCEPNGYYLYDQCIDGMVALKFIDNSNRPVMLSSIDALLKKDQTMK